MAAAAAADTGPADIAGHTALVLADLVAGNLVVLLVLEVESLVVADNPAGADTLAAGADIPVVAFADIAPGAFADTAVLEQ